MKRIALLFAAAMPAFGHSAIRITEWMYSGVSGEFVEITNISSQAQSLVGWSFDDDSRIAGSTDLSSLGTLAANESAIIAEPADVAAFKTAWGLGAGVKVLGGNLNNLGRADEVNIYDAGSALADRLTFGDQVIIGSIRTQNKSGNTGLANLGANNVLGWTLSSVGDAYGSWTSTGADIANPGIYAPVPEPASLAVIAMASAFWARRRKA